MERTNKPIAKPIILTNDPSMTAWGYSVINHKGKIIECGCIKTEPQHKKTRIRKGDDSVRRISEIVQGLLDVINSYGVNLILSELPHGSQNASAAVMIGVVTGITQTISDCLNIPVEWYSEQDSKKCVLHKKSATKQEMIDAITKLYDVPWTGVKYKDEAIADAIAVYHTASKQSDVIKYFKQ